MTETKMIDTLTDEQERQLGIRDGKPKTAGKVTLEVTPEGVFKAKRGDKWATGRTARLAMESLK